MLPLDPGKLNIKSEGAVDWSRGSAKRARSVFLFIFFSTGCRRKGTRGHCLPQSQLRREKMES